MARDAVTPVSLSLNTAANAKAATIMTAINTTNGAKIDVDGVEPQKLAIHVKNTAESEKDFTVKAGVYSSASLGDLAVAVAATDGEKMIVVESARFKQSDGYLYIDFETGMTGLIGAYKIP